MQARHPDFVGDRVVLSFRRDDRLQLESRSGRARAVHSVNQAAIEHLPSSATSAFLCEFNNEEVDFSRRCLSAELFVGKYRVG
jgi:hypothetical protein